MKNEIVSLIFFMALSTLINHVRASDGSATSAASPTSQFLGSPLLILVAVVAIDIIALVHRKLRK